MSVSGLLSRFIWTPAGRTTRDRPPGRLAWRAPGLIGPRGRNDKDVFADSLRDRLSLITSPLLPDRFVEVRFSRRRPQ